MNEALLKTHARAAWYYFYHNPDAVRFVFAYYSMRLDFLVMFTREEWQKNIRIEKWQEFFIDRIEAHWQWQSEKLDKQPKVWLDETDKV